MSRGCHNRFRESLPSTRFAQTWVVRASLFPSPPQPRSRVHPLYPTHSSFRALYRSRPVDANGAYSLLRGLPLARCVKGSLISIAPRRTARRLRTRKGCPGSFVLGRVIEISCITSSLPALPRVRFLALPPRRAVPHRTGTARTLYKERATHPDSYRIIRGHLARAPYRRSFTVWRKRYTKGTITLLR